MGKYILVDNNTRDKQSILNILRSFVFSDKSINIYDPNKVYNKNDQAYYIDEKTGNIVVITANTNNITGPLNLRYWSSSSLSTTISNNMDKLVYIGPRQPTDQNVKIWVAPLSYRTHTLPEPYDPGETDLDKLTVIFTDGEIPIIDDPNTELDANFFGIIIDREGVTSYTEDSETTDSFDAAGTIIVDEQEDIHVGDNAPTLTDPALLWADTEPTDDI